MKESHLLIHRSNSSVRFLNTYPFSLYPVAIVCVNSFGTIGIANAIQGRERKEYLCEIFDLMTLNRRVSNFKFF